MNESASNPKPRRRWFRPRYSLTTFFLIVTVICVWLGYSLNWIRQRHEVLQRKDIGIVQNYFSPRLSAPGGLWLLGETGIQSLHVAAPGYLPEEVERIQRLFPEASIEYILLPVGGGQ